MGHSQNDPREAADRLQALVDRARKYPEPTVWGEGDVTYAPEIERIAGQHLDDLVAVLAALHSTPTDRTSTPPVAATGLREALERIRDLCSASIEDMRALHGSEQRVLMAVIPGIAEAALRAESVAAPPKAVQELADLRDAVEIMDQKLTPYGERDEDGTIATYIVGDSTWHRVLAIARGSKSEAAEKALAEYRALHAPPALDAARMNRQTAYDALPRDADDSMYELADKIFDALSLAATPASGEPAAPPEPGPLMHGATGFPGFDHVAGTEPERCEMCREDATPPAAGAGEPR